MGFFRRPHVETSRLMPKVGNQAMCISVNGGYATSPTNLHLWDYTTAAEQGWILEKAETGNYKRVSNLSYQTYDQTIENAKARSKATHCSVDITIWNKDILLQYYTAAQGNVLGGPLAGYKEAAKLLSHFLNNDGKSGTPYQLDVKTMVTEAPIAQYLFKNNINTFLQSCEEIVTGSGIRFYIGSKLPISTMIFPENANYPSSVPIGKNWWYAVDDMNGYIVGYCDQNADGTYVAHLRYFARDFYDWVEDSPKRGGW